MIKINVGKVIYEKCKDLVDNRCYPIVAEATTDKPFICYSRTSSTPRTTKDRYTFQLDSTVEINIVTDKYDEGIAILEQVYDRFDDFEGIVKGIEVVDTKILTIAEFYMNNAYVQTITINIKTT